MSMTESQSLDILVAAEVVARTEQFTPGYAVQSVDFAIEGADEETVLSIQRAVGAEADDPPEVCLVLSPSQQCAENPFVSVILSRNTLYAELSQEAQAVFGAHAFSLSFDATDDLFLSVRNQLLAIFSGFTLFRHEKI